MSIGQYQHASKAAGVIVTAPLYNNAHQNQLNNDIPSSCGAHSDDSTQFRATTDPAPAGVPAPVVALGTELEQLRFVIADIKKQLNGGVAVSQWYTPVSPTQAAVKAHGARVFRNTTQSITQEVFTACSFNTVRYDTGVVLPTFDPFFSIGQPTRLTAQAAGVYEITGFAQWATGAIGTQMTLLIRRNGTQYIAEMQGNQNATEALLQEVGTQYLLAKNDYVELVVFQKAANPFNIVNPEFGLELLGVTTAVPAPTLFTLTVAEAGSGTGTVAWTPTGNGSTSPESFVSGTVVTLTATPTFGTFTAWSGDVPGGHETDNPLTVTMDQNRSLTATFQAQTSFFTVGLGGPQSPLIAPTNTNVFFDIGSGSIATSTVGNAQRLMPTTIIVDRIDATMAVALTGAQAFDLRLNIGGVGDANLVLHINSSGTYFTTSAGSVTLHQDDLVCWEAANFAGGLTTPTLTHIVFRYHPNNSTSGFIVGRPVYSTVGNVEIACFAANVGDVVNGRAWLPKGLTVDQGTLVADSATGAGTATILTLFKNDNVTSVGSAITLSDPATFVRTTVGGLLPGTTTGVGADDHNFRRSSTGSPAAVNVRPMASYLATSPNQAFSFFNTGRNLFNHTFGGGSTVFPALFGFAASASFATSEASAHMRWPVKGQFEFFGANVGLDIGTTADLILRINGVDTALKLSYSGTGTNPGSSNWQQDYSTTVNVAAGDLVNYVVRRTAGAGTTLTLTAVIGFHAT